MRALSMEMFDLLDSAENKDGANKQSSLTLRSDAMNNCTFACVPCAQHILFLTGMITKDEAMKVVKDEGSSDLLDTCCT